MSCAMLCSPVVVKHSFVLRIVYLLMAKATKGRIGGSSTQLIAVLEAQSRGDQPLVCRPDPDPGIMSSSPRGLPIGLKM